MSALPSPPLRWIQLDRRFLPAGASSLEGASSAWLARFGVTKGWSEILVDGCTVILGERGTGKTEELRACTDQQRRSGRVAFFLPVEAVANRGVAGSLRIDDLDVLRTWTGEAADEAWFFLDAVDEAALRGRMLSSALTAFAQELEPHLRRIHVVISSRASDWRSGDEDEVRGLARHLHSADGKGLPQLLQLAPLDEGQVSALAAHYGVADVQALLKSVRDSNSWSFVERPLDVQWLATYWKANRRLGSLRDLVNFNADERLKEKPERPTVLSGMKAREGAMDLALASILAKKVTFRFPEDMPDPRAEDSIDPRDILDGWTNVEIRDLLARGLFDEATYGRVRIHHRSVQEFLAAERLLQMRRDGLPRADLEALLFRKSSGRTVVPQHIAPVLAWLAATEREVLEKAILFAPEHLIDEGDPAALPPSIRRETLSAYAENYGDRERVYHHFDTFGLKRFGCAELVDTMRHLLGSTDKPDHIKGTLLRIAKAGQVAELADSALALAMSVDAPPGLRELAIEVAAMPGPNASARRAQLVTLVSHPAARTPEVLATLLDKLFPDDLDVPSLVAALAAVGKSREDLVTSLNVLVPRLPARCTPADRSRFLELLTEEMIGPPAGNDQGQATIKPERLWLAESLAALTAAVIEDGPPFPSFLGTSIALIRCVNGYGEGNVGLGLGQVLEGHPLLRRALFWQQAELVARKRKRFPHEWWDVDFSGRIAAGQKDIEWLGADVVTKPDVRHRLLAFACFVRAVPATVQGDAPLKLLADLAARSDAHNGSDAMTKRLHRLRNPPLVPPDSAFAQMELRRRVQELKERSLAEQNRKALLARIEGIRTGEDANALVHFYSTCLRGQPDSRGESVSIESIKESYGDEIADAAREGFRQFWRSHTPERRESHEPHSTPYDAILGLNGIRFDIETGLDVCTLPERLMESAVVYGTWELSGFPDWLSRLARARPDLVRDVFTEAIRLDFEYQPPPKNPDTGRLLFKLPSASAEIRRACAPALLDLLMAKDPPGLPALESTLEVLHSTSTLASEDACSLAVSRVAHAAQDLPRFALWWCFLAAYAPLAAVDGLETALNSSAAAGQLAEEVCSRLWALRDDRSPLNHAVLRSDGPALARLIPLVYSNVLLREDISHQGAYSPGKRDRAQDLRDSLITWLSGVPGPATVEALDQLADSSAFSSARDWIRHLADVRAAENVGTPMSIYDTRRFIRSAVLEPNTSEELFAIARSRLEDIQAYLLNDDFSVRQVYNPEGRTVLEEPVQIYLARELELRRRGQYSVAREPEVTRKKRPDIRLFNARCAGPVTIEIKIAERWTLPQLEAALTDQLVGTYMKANNSRHGVLAVCSSGPAKTWEAGPGAPNINFTQLVARLRQLARDLGKKEGLVDLEVVGIDFH